eukprot:CAMPEP_0201511628 /NCGR_PEP_ID=MMETSP0161_2-20130828/4045_1 /ASSEMBLY_ACC=CAM_ASM_000251 /TAXON_ID=180227 /ORGANISM="Neoparamoeba aestuarina, Strain SoJaBio B1-5/56/2" /LENGTH=382 /DNA_ID=CAMNT_0047907193 /DNA_START=105 /DNA_END=1253 /DNA_ORIENTATION=+
MSLLLIDQDRYTPYYRHYFFNKEHVNFLGYDKDSNPILISIERQKNQDPTVPILVRAFVRTCLPWSVEVDADMWVLIPATEIRNIKRALEMELETYLRPKEKLYELMEDKAVDNLFLKAEDAMLMKGYKFGVLHVTKGQGGEGSREEDIFGNCDLTPDFEEFLDFLGDRVQMRAFPHFRAGLDTKNDTTGKESVYKKFNDHSIMFHVGPLLPSGEGDQHLAKKRHIGNDIVVVLFKDKDADDPIDPKIFVSEFNHIFAVVQKVSLQELERLESEGVLTDFNRNKTYYRIAFCSKEGVHSSEPAIPYPGVFEKNEKLHRFFLTKLINSERSALYANKFVTKLLNTRQAVFRDIAEDLMKLVKKENQKKSTSWLSRAKLNPHQT